MTYRLRYTGNRKITAITMIRKFTGFGLKTVLKALKNPNGFLVTSRDAEQIVMGYMEQGLNPFIDRLSAWTITEHHATQVDDLRAVGGL